MLVNRLSYNLNSVEVDFLGVILGSIMRVTKGNTRSSDNSECDACQTFRVPCIRGPLWGSCNGGYNTA